ncbi:transposase, partial [Streptomyces sp. NPDC002122]|uniref:transposase n=1 Tax=Streptomyces sp. NPDC002122 TaxID=3154407 RepID=UPI0033268B73
MLPAPAPARRRHPRQRGPNRRNIRTNRRGRAWLPAWWRWSWRRGPGPVARRVHQQAPPERGRPLSLIVTAGQRADCTQLKSVLEKIRVPRPGPGRPRKKPDSLAADMAYSNGPCREYLKRRGIRHTIPEKTDSQAARLRKGTRGGRPPGFDEVRYRTRNTVERAINLLTRKAEKGVNAVGVPPVPGGLRGTLATDDNAARRGARRREPGMIGKTPPRTCPADHGSGCWGTAVLQSVGVMAGPRCRVP